MTKSTATATATGTKATRTRTRKVASVAELQNVASEASVSPTKAPLPASEGKATLTDENDSKISTLVAKLRAMVAKAEQSAREESELFSDDESEHDLAETAARSEQLRKFRKMLKSDSTDQTMKTAISRYLESLKPVDKLAGARGRKASFRTKVGASGSVQITGPYAGLAGWPAGLVLSITIDGDKLTLAPVPAES